MSFSCKKSPSFDILVKTGRQRHLNFVSATDAKYCQTAIYTSVVSFGVDTWSVKPDANLGGPEK